MGTDKVGDFIDNRLYNLCVIQAAFGAGSVKAYKLYELLNKLGLLDVPFDDMILNDKIFSKQLRAQLTAVRNEKIDGILKDCERHGIRILPIFDSDYPERLRNIPVPPVILYVKGNLPDVDNEPLFCIVGPRKVSRFGQKAAFSLARRISKAGMVVVSGSAVGTDAAAHLGALDAMAPSVMVVAEGILTQLRSKNRALCEKVLKKGCIISENYPSGNAVKFSFPVRNRLLSGLSLGVALIEAPTKSGSLITAAHAIEQGRDVFVVPGGLADKCYKGSNALLRDGAIPLIDTYDIFSRYIFDFPDKINIEKAFSGDKKKKTQKKSLSGLSKEAVLVYNKLVKPEFTVDDLSCLDIDGAALLSALTELELEHLIISLPGGIYKKS